MSKYLVTYDLKKSYSNDRSEDYEKLYNQFQRYLSSARVTESSWVIATFKSDAQVRDELKMILNSNDSLFVGELTGNAAWNNCIDSTDKIKKTME